jgi:hypothetical protein
VWCIISDCGHHRFPNLISLIGYPSRSNAMNPLKLLMPKHVPNVQYQTTYHFSRAQVEAQKLPDPYVSLLNRSCAIRVPLLSGGVTDMARFPCCAEGRSQIRLILKHLDNSARSAAFAITRNGAHPEHTSPFPWKHLDNCGWNVLLRALSGVCPNGPVV